MISVTDVIQVAAVLVAAAAAVAALAIATIDRRTQLRIARHQAQMSRLAIELEYAVRLSAVRNRRGSHDKDESKRLGAEALALAGVVGPRWVPVQFAHAMNNKSPEELRSMLNDDERVTDRSTKWKIEAGLAVQSITDALYDEIEKQPSGRRSRRSGA